MAKLYILPTCMEIHQNILTFYHRVQIQAWDEFVNLFLLQTILSHLLRPFLYLCVEPFHIHQRILYSQMRLCRLRARVTIQECSEEPRLLLLFTFLYSSVFGNEYYLAPKVHKCVFDFRWSE